MSAGGRRGTRCALLRSTQAGGEAPSRPARLRKAQSRRLRVQRLREGRGKGHADLGGSHEARGEECSVPEVKLFGGEILRRGDDFGGDLQFQQKSLRQCQLTSSPSPIWEP